MDLAISRRSLLASSALLLPGAEAIAATTAPDTDGFVYEVTRSDAEWKELLGEAAFDVMREGKTEVPKSHPLWDSLEAGTYCCRGCDLTLYDARWKVVLDMGWLFFKHSHANAVLTEIDWPDGSGMAEAFASLAAVEVHCRRCGSHLGHIVSINDGVLHCINGTSMNFLPA